jgi:hypothetical protein
VEQVYDCDVALKNFLQPALHLDHQQGMSAQVEEVVVNSDPLQAQQFLPDTGNGPLHFAGRRNIRCAQRQQ